MPIAKIVFKNKNETKKMDYNNKFLFYDKKSNLTFKGKTSITAKLISNIINNENIQKIAKKGQNTNFMQHAYVMKDVIATGCFAAATALNNTINKDKKDSLICNAGIATGLTIAGGYAAEKTLRKPMQILTKAFIDANKNDKNLFKYLSGLKTLEPLLILSSIYYIGIPGISTFLSGKFNNKSKNDNIKK